MADEIKIKAPSVEQNINVNVTGEAEIHRLYTELQAAQASLDRVNSTLQSTETELDRVRSQFDDFAHGNGIDILQEELERFKNTAEQSVDEFRAFLQSVNLNDAWGSNDWQFSDLFEQIKDGSITASRAILRVKTDYRALMEEAYQESGGMFDTQMVQGFTAALDHLGETIGIVVERLNSIEQNGVKAAGGSGGGDVANVLSQIENAARGMSEEVKGSYESITSLVNAMNEYANLDSTRILGVSQAFRNIADIGKGSYGTKSIENIVYLTKQLQALSASGSSIRFDFTGFNDLKVSKASVSNLATYLPQIASVNVSKLEKLSQVNLTNFNNVKVSKSAIENISRLTEAIQVLKEVKAASVKADESSINITGGEREKQDTSHYKDATRAVKEYYAMLTQLGKAKSDVTLTSEGWKSESGQRDELAAALNRTKTAFDLYTNAENQSKMTDEERINFLRLMTSESEKYALSAEAQANKEITAAENAARKAEEKAQREAAAAAKAMAAKEAAAQKAAEAEEAAEARRAEASETSADKIQINLLKIDKLRESVNTTIQNAGKFGVDSDNLARLKELAAELDVLRANTANGSVTNQDFANSFTKIRLAADIAGASVKDEANTIKTILKPETAAFGTAQQELSRKMGQAKNALTGFTAAKNSNNLSSRNAYTAIQNEYKSYEQLTAKLHSGEMSEEDFAAAVKHSSGVVSENIRIIKASGDAHQTTGEKIAGAIKKFSQWFSVTRVVMAAYRTIKQMIQTSIELEDAFAQLKIVTGTTDAGMEKFSQTAVNLSKNLGQSVVDVTKAIETFSRLGHELPEASTLAEYATILANTAAVGTDETTTGLTSIIKGFQLDVNDAEHVADVLIEVGQKYAVSASELMEAFERSGAALHATNVSFEKSAGLIAAANASIQDASVVGTALKTVSARIRGSKTDLEELGEDTEDLAEGFSKYANEIKALTGFNIMVEGSTTEFKDLYDIMEGIAGVWDDLSDTQQARVSEILGGTRQLQVISSIIGNWGDAAEAYADAMGAAGTATEANDIYMQTTTAHIAQMKSAFAELSKEMFGSKFLQFFVDFAKGIIEALTATIKFIDKVTALKVLLIAFASTIAMTGAIKLFTAGITKIISFFKYIINIIPNAISMWKAYAASNTAAAVAEGEAAVGAVTFSAALQASIPVIGLVLAALTAVVGTLAIVGSEAENAGDALQMEQEETANEMKRTAEAAADEAEEIANLYEEYYNAADAAVHLTGSIEDYNKARDNLIKGIGVERDELKKLIDKYGDYNKALAAATAKKLGYNLIDIQGGIDAAAKTSKDLGFADIVGGKGSGTWIDALYKVEGMSEEQLQKTIDEANSILQILQGLPDNLGITMTLDNFPFDEEGKDVGKAIAIFFNNTITEAEKKAYGNMAELVQKYKALKESLYLLNEAGIGSDNSYYKRMYDSYQYIKDSVEEYLGLIDEYNTTLAQKEFYTYLSQNDLPETKEQFDSLRQSIIDAVAGSGQYKGTIDDITTAVDDFLRGQSNFSGFFDDAKTSIDSATESVNAFINALSKVNTLNAGLAELDKIYADIYDKGDFDWSSILANDAFTSAFKGLGDVYTDFIETVANSPTNIAACQEAFDNLTTAYLKQSGILDNVTDATRNATVAMLEQMGISNAAAIVDANLAYQKEVLKYTTGDYADMTYEEILELYNECEAGTTTQQVLAELAIAKMQVNNEQINSSNDIEQLIALANTANATSASLANLARAKSLMAQAESLEKEEAELITSGADPRGISVVSINAYNYRKWAEEAAKAPLEYDTIDASKFKASYSGGSSTRSAKESAKKAADKASKEAEKAETWFEKQYKLHKHLVAMEQEDDEDYYAWLNSAMNQAYNEGILELDDFRKYQEEVFSGLRSLFKDYLNDVEHEISMREHFNGEAKNIISLYKTLISKVETEIKAAYAKGLTDNDDYVQELLDKLYGYKDKVKDIQDEITDNAKDAVADLIDYVQDMQKQELEDQKDALDKKLDNLKDFYDKQKEMIQDARDAEKYEDEQAEKRKSVTDIQAQLAMLQNDDSAWAQKRKAELNQELADAQKELDEFEKDHAVELALDAIEEAYNAQEAQIQAEMDALDAELNNPELMFNKALTAIQTNTNNLYQEMLAFNRKYGTGNDEDVKDKYEEAYKALLEYKQLNGKDYNGVTLSNATGYKSETGSYDVSKPKATTTTTTAEPTTTTATTSMAPKLDDATKRKIAAAIWNGNYGWGTGSTRSSRLAEVFSTNNGIQALVNQGVGKMDGAPGNDYTYLNMRKKFKGYASGTKKAIAGLHSIDELGTETIFESADGTRYKMFSGGERVLNAKASDFLYEFANGGGEILEKIIKAALGGGIFDKIMPVVNNNEINMGDIVINGDCKAQTVSEIRRAQRDVVNYMLKEFNRLNK